MSTTDYSNDPGTVPGGAHRDVSGDESGDESTKDQARQAAGSAADEGKRVAGVAQEEVKNVAAEAQNQVRGLLAEATAQIDEQSKAQKSRLVDTVRSFGDDLASMRSEGQQDGVAAQVVQQVAGQARSLASHLDDRNPSELLDDVRSFARRRPGTFLLGAITAGVVVGRVTRGARAAQDQPSAAGAEPTPAHPGSVAETGVVSPVAGQGEVCHIDEDLGGASTPTDLGAKGIEMSEAGVTGTNGIWS